MTFVYFEKFLRFIGNVLLAITSAKYEHNDRFCAPREVLGDLSNFAEQRDLGTGQWIQLIEKLWRPVKDAIPARLAEMMEQGWLKKLREVSRMRNMRIHEGHTGETDVLHSLLWKTVRAMPTMEWELINVVSVHPRRRGSHTLDVHRLTGIGAPAITQMEDRQREVTEGLWMKNKDRWWLLSPLLDYRRCDDSDRWDLYMSRGVPSGSDMIHQTGFLQRGSYEAPINGDASPELAQMACAIQVYQMNHASRADEHTGLHNLADLERIEREASSQEASRRTWPGDDPDPKT